MCVQSLLGCLGFNVCTAAITQREPNGLISRALQKLLIIIIYYLCLLEVICNLKHSSSSFPDNNVKVGRVGEDPFLSYQFDRYIIPYYIGVHTGWGAPGEWEYCGKLI